MEILVSRIAETDAIKHITIFIAQKQRKITKYIAKK
jgi:hypothetical protein